MPDAAYQSGKEQPCIPTSASAHTADVGSAARRPASSSASRRKGLQGEREVADLWRRYGFGVRGLEGAGDHLVIARNGFTIHSEVKRTERLGLWESWAQAERETPLGCMTVLSVRRNRSEWLAVVELDDLASLVREATKALPTPVDNPEDDG